MRADLVEKALQFDLGFDSQVDFSTYSLNELQHLVGSHMDNSQTVPLLVEGVENILRIGVGWGR